MEPGDIGQVSVRGVRAAYTLGLIVMPGTFVLIAWSGGMGNLPGGWWTSLFGLGLAGLIWVSRGRKLLTGGASVFRQVFSFHWLYRLLWRGYRILGGGVVFVSSLLEGEAGILWTLLFLMILLSLITSQAGAGG
jgi:hypothetical protein